MNYTLDNPPKKVLSGKKIAEIYKEKRELTDKQKNKLNYYLKVKEKHGYETESSKKAKYIAEKLGLKA